MTYSFVPDGTSVGGVSSTLFQTLNKAASTATWKQQFEQAAAVWEQVAHINLVLVSDDGSPVGTQGDQQGDARFGDIRIGAVPEQGGTLAEAFLPPPINGGTIAGDLFVNSNVAWHVNANYDLESVAIHELGHALGMDHSQVQQAVMYATYTGIKQTLNSDDVSGIQSIYGAPTDPSNNTSYTSAVNLNSQINSNGQITLSAEYISGSTNQDWYKVTVPSNTTGSMVVTMQSSNLSELSPRLEILNSSLNWAVQSYAQNAYGATVSVTVTGVQPGQTFYIRAMPAGSGATSTGAYGLQVNFGSQAQSSVAPPSTTVAAQPDQTSTSSNETTGGTTSSSGGGLLGGLLGVVGNLVGGVLQLLQIGTLTGYGEALSPSGPVTGGHAQPHGSGHGQTVHHLLPPRLHHAHVTVNLHPRGSASHFHRAHLRTH